MSPPIAIVPAAAAVVAMSLPPVEMARPLDDPAGARTLAEALRRAAMRLRAAGIEDGRAEARLLLAVAGLSRERQIASPDMAIPPAMLGRWAELIERRCRREPLAYIRGTAPFWDFEVVVGPGVLVPRPETEILVEAVLARLRGRSVQRILDLGTGTGCIVLALLRQLPGAQGIGLDRSEVALRCASENARRLGLADRLGLVAGDWADAPAGPFDLIVGNPPYVADAELPGLQPEVRDHEPALALLGGSDGLDAYRVIAPLVAARLAPGGLVALEHGAGQGAAVAGLLATAGLEGIEHHRDLAGIERCVVARSGEARGIAVAFSAVC
jgi:release factor glutamine methyltransferase